MAAQREALLHGQEDFAYAEQADHGHEEIDATDFGVKGRLWGFRGI